MASKASRRSTEVLDPVGEALKFAGLDLGARPARRWQVFHLGRDLVESRPVEALDLGVTAY